MAEVEVLLAREARALAERVRGWSATRWSAPTPGADGSRADRMTALVAELAVLGRQAGSGAPAGVQPSRLGNHALADQLVVVADDLLAAVRDRPGQDGVVTRALSSVLAARTALDGTPPPADAAAAIARLSRR